MDTGRTVDSPYCSGKQMGIRPDIRSRLDLTGGHRLGKTNPPSRTEARVSFSLGEIQGASDVANGRRNPLSGEVPRRMTRSFRVMPRHYLRTTAGPRALSQLSTRRPQLRPEFERRLHRCSLLRLGRHRHERSRGSWRLGGYSRVAGCQRSDAGY